MNINMNKNALNNNGQLIVIAEIASAHGGDVTAIKKMIAAASATGADFIKLQIYQFDQLVAGDNSKFQDLKTIEIQPEEWIKILDYAAEINANLIAEVFDKESFILLKGRNEIKGFKIPTADITDIDFINLVCTENKAIFLGIGGATNVEIDKALECLGKHNEIETILLHGIQSFPTKVEDCLLSRIPILKEKYNCDIGYADHIDAEDTLLAFTIPAMAVSMGANVIEKHITLDRSEKGYDYYSSLNPSEFSDFVMFIRSACQSIGGPESYSTLTTAEISYRNNMKKFAILESKLEVGSSLDSALIAYKRTSVPGMTRGDIELQRKHSSIKNLEAGHILQSKDFE